MSLACALTGRVPHEPVISSTGYLFDKAALVEHMNFNDNMCPVTKQRIELGDLTPVKMVDNEPATLRTISYANIPDLLNSLKVAYEDSVKALYLMKLDLDKTNVQLQHALFQNDGATRTIKRLQLEVGAHNAKIGALEDHLQTQRSEIAVINAANGSFAGPGGDDEEGAAAAAGAGGDKKKDNEFDNFTELWTNRLMEYDANFGKSRRDGAYAALKARCTPVVVNKQVAQMASYDKHQKSAPGVLCLALNPAQFDGLMGGDVNTTGFRADRVGNVFTGGKDGHVESWNLLSGEQYQRFAAHDDAVSSIAAGVMQVPNPHYNANGGMMNNGAAAGPTYAQNVLVTACTRMHEAKVWVNKARSGGADKWQLKFHLNFKHLREVHVHPLGDLIILISLDGMIGFADAQTGKWLRKAKVDFRESAFQMMAMNTFKLHPNGKAAIAAVGETLQLWDVPKGEYTKSLATKHKDPVVALDISGNATNVVSASYSREDGKTHLILWDLRKQENSVQEVHLEGEIAPGGLCFDKCGQYLAVAFKDNRVELHYFESKTTLAVLCVLENTKHVVGMQFGPDASYLATCGSDRRVMLQQAPSADEEGAAKRMRMQES